MNKIILPDNINYTGVFLNFRCNLECPYCINKYGVLKTDYNLLSGKEWVKGLNRIETRGDLPVTLQGGEPTLHPDFFYIVNNIRKDIKIDLLTNLQFNIKDFMDNIHPDRLFRDAPYAPIRISYHPLKTDAEKFFKKVLALYKKGFKIGIYGLDLPEFKDHNNNMKTKCNKYGIDFRIKQFLGEYNGRFYGNYRYPDAVKGTLNIKVKCKPSELLINPAGDIFKCHQHLYSCTGKTGNILDNNYKGDFTETVCSDYGICNPCDIKIKTDRFQKYGHTSVEIKKL